MIEDKKVCFITDTVDDLVHKHHQITNVFDTIIFKVAGRDATTLMDHVDKNIIPYTNRFTGYKVILYFTDVNLADMNVPLIDVFKVLHYYSNSMGTLSGFMFGLGDYKCKKETAFAHILTSFLDRLLLTMVRKKIDLIFTNTGYSTSRPHLGVADLVTLKNQRGRISLCLNLGLSAKDGDSLLTYGLRKGSLGVLGSKFDYIYYMSDTGKQPTVNDSFDLQDYARITKLFTASQVVGFSDILGTQTFFKDMLCIKE